MEIGIEHYDFLRVLGTGAFGKAYLVQRKIDNELYVIKEQKVKETKESTLEDVKNEIVQFKKMRHPNVLLYHLAWSQEDSFYILMEFATAGTLQELLDRCEESPLTEEKALYLFSQMVLGVHHIHSKHIIHRDLKPSNILLTGKDGDIVKIGDFGVCLDGSRYVAKNSCGSLFYMAPEVLTAGGDTPYDKRCDIWSLGVMFYEMVVGEYPFDNPADQSCNNPWRARPLAPDVASAEVVHLIGKLMQVDAEKRPTSSQLVLCPILTKSVQRFYQNLDEVRKQQLLGEKLPV